MSEPIAAADPQLERYRSYLLLLARMQLDARPQGKIDPSDIVQQTLLEAHAHGPAIVGDERGLGAWLRRALVNNLRDALRALRRGKRDVAREQSLEAAVDESSARLANWLAADHTSPSVKAARNEELAALGRLRSTTCQSRSARRLYFIICRAGRWPRWPSVWNGPTQPWQGFCIEG